MSYGNKKASKVQKRDKSISVNHLSTDKFGQYLHDKINLKYMNMNQKI